MTIDKAAAWPEFSEFVRSRPEGVQEMMHELPPLSIVRALDGLTLLVPAPGVEGLVVSYYEDLRVGIVAPATIPHPEHGWGAAKPGDPLKAAVSPGMLLLVREGIWTRADVDRALGDREAP